MTVENQQIADTERDFHDLVVCHVGGPVLHAIARALP